MPSSAAQGYITKLIHDSARVELREQYQEIINIDRDTRHDKTCYIQNTLKLKLLS